VREYKDSWEELPYTGGSQGTFDGQILEKLDSVLAKLNTPSAIKMGIVDTCIGGHGALKLAQLLLRLHQSYGKQHWTVGFHLLYSRNHPTSKFPTKSFDIFTMGTDEIYFDVRYYAVPNLLVEDWGEAIGYRVDWSGSGSDIIKPSTVEGELILREANGSVKLIHSPELNAYIDTLIAASVSDAVRTTPGFIYKGDVWDRYVKR